MQPSLHWTPCSENKETGKAFFTPAVGISLMLFYAFAMQCMSTLAIVYRETRHWKWPLIQFIYMGVLAYISSFIAYQLLSRSLTLQIIASESIEYFFRKYSCEPTIDEKIARSQTIDY